MPGRLASRSSRAEEPRPFSSEWLSTDRPPEVPRAPFRLPDWIPDRRSMSTGLMVIVSLAVAIVALQGGSRAPDGAATVLPGISAPTAGVEPTVAVVAEPTAASAAAAEASELQTDAIAAAMAPGLEQESPPLDLAVDPAIDGVIAPPDGPLLPEYRILTYYGHPHDPAMGIAGEHSIDDLANLLRSEAANYAAADPSRPVVPAFEIIATVAQPDPGNDGTYILDTSRETLDKYIDYAADNGLLVVLDVQIGRGTVASEIEKVRDLLALPHVHLAIDPEFAVAEGQVPGEYIGSITAESIAYAQQTLAEISAANGIPPKLLIVHQFREDMIQNKEQLGPYPGVQLVIDADGFGSPVLKTAIYNFLVRDEPVEFAGVKLFYRQDVPVMTPREILALVPAPDVVIYQ